MTTPHPERVVARHAAFDRGSVLHFARNGLRAIPGVLALAVLIEVRVGLAADEIHWTITGPTSVTFSWRGESTEDVIVYGIPPWSQVHFGFASTPSPVPDSSPGPFWEARLTGLRENTLYTYWIGDGPARTFRTPPPRGSSGFWFAEQADVGSSLSWPNVGITQGMIAQDNPNIPGDDRPRFVVVPGDLTYGDQTSLADVDQHFNDVMAWSQDAAYMPAWGNHEWGTPGDFEPDNLNNYEGRFDLPNSMSTPGATIAAGNGPGDDWYWFDYGNVRFITFPEPFDGTWTDWVSDVNPIMAEAQADPSITFIVTFGHRPAYSSGSDHDSVSDLAASMRGLHASYPKYLLSLHAHSHHYERTNPALTGGVVFIVGSGGGSSLGGLLSTRPPWSAYRLNFLHHMRFHVQPDRIVGYGICGPMASGAGGPCPQGTVFDTFTILSPVVAVEEPGTAARSLRVLPESNPAHGRVALRVEGGAAGTQSVEVHDTSGRLVRVLGGSWSGGGPRRVLWDGADSEGRTTPPGVYLITVRDGAHTARTRVALLR